jgi:predicted nucleic acid-binding protein
MGGGSPRLEEGYLARKRPQRRSVRAFVDTSALLALSHTRDQYHARARAAARRYRAAGGRFLSSTLVLGEFHSHLLSLRGPVAARDALVHLLADDINEWMDVSVDVVRDAQERWLTRFVDQRVSLTDAVSFELMSREAVSHAFAYDRHFEMAGFQLLT